MPATTAPAADTAANRRASRIADRLTGAKRSLGTWSRQATRGAKHVPLSSAALVVLWVTRIAYGFNSDRIREYLGAGSGVWADPLRLVTAGLTSATTASAVVATVGILTLGLVAEKTLGSARFAAWAVGLQVAGTAVGWAIITLLVAGGGYWGQSLAGQVVLTPSVWLCGVAAYASARLPAQWRRRVRVVVVTIAVTLLLFSGQAADFPRIAATLLGLGAGQWQQFGHFRATPASVREKRLLVVVSLLIVSVSPFLAGLNPDAAAPLSKVGIVTFHPAIESLGTTGVCATDPGGLDCAQVIAAVQSAGVGAFALNQLSVIVMLVIGTGLIRGRRLAWWSALVVMGTTGLVNVWQMRLVADNYESHGGGWWLDAFGSPATGTIDSVMFVLDAAGVCFPWTAAVAVVVVARRNFRIPSSAGTLGKLARRVLVSAGVSGALWIGGARLLRDGFTPHATWMRITAEWPLRYLPPFLGDNLAHALIPVDESTLNLSVWTGVVFWGGILLSLWRAFVAVPDPHAENSRIKAAAILASGDGDHLSRMTLWKGNSYWFDPETGGYVAYRVHRAVAVTLGEPVLPKQAIDRAVGDRGRGGGHAGEQCAGPVAERQRRRETTLQLRREVAARFERFASLKGLRIAWYAVRGSFAGASAADGWHRVVVAEEAVVPTSLVAFKGKKFQDVRTARNRAKKENIHVEWIRWAAAGPAMADSIAALSEDWVADKALPEMGFTLGGIDELKDPDIELGVAVDDSGRVHGVTSWLPVHEDGEVAGVILDFMRRDADGFRPVVEYLIAEALIRAEAKGLPWISLSAAPLARSGAPDDLLAEILDRVGASMEPLYGFRSLAFFKRKFHPTHVPWLLLYRDELALPAIGMAIGQCYLPQVGAGQLLHAAKVMAGDRSRG